MKQILIVLALVLSSVASAASIKLHEARYDSNVTFTPEFQINKSLGRAWVNVSEATYSGDSSSYNDNRVLVEGLSYDAAEKAVVMETDGARVVCSNLYNRRWVIDIGGSLNDTGRCTFTQKKVKVDVDNGFEINRVTMIQIFLNVE